MVWWSILKDGARIMDGSAFVELLARPPLADDPRGILGACMLFAACLVILVFVVGIFVASRRSRTPSKSRNAQSRAPRIAQPTQDPTQSLSSSSPRKESSVMGFKLPKPPAGYGKAKWIPPGAEVTVAGRRLRGGMIYVGTSLPDLTGSADPCLIDPSKPVAPQGDYSTRQTDYWPSYSQIPPAARAAYLKWLEDGRRHPDADIGYVFLFFYGLERRAIIDALQDSQAVQDRPAIEREIQELLAVYGEQSASFRGYAANLLAWMRLSQLGQTLYDHPLPALQRNYELPIELKVALGQAARDGVPLPATLALAWAQLAPEIRLGTPAKRCPDQFSRLFLLRYPVAFKDGFVLPRGRTKLRYEYRAASSGLRSAKKLVIDFGDTPDISVLAFPVNTLTRFVEAVATELGAYSRYVGRKGASRDDLEARLLLPFELWSGKERKAVDDLKAEVGTEAKLLAYEALRSRLGGGSPLAKNSYLALQGLLRSQGLGIEPDVEDGAKLPEAASNVAVFALRMEPKTSSESGLAVARLMLQFAAALAGADGAFDDRELDHLRQQVSGWTHLTESQRQRLKAHLLLLRDAPVKLTALKKRLEVVPQRIRESIAPFLAVVAQSDGTISPQEVKSLEKIYKVLGVDPTEVFQRLHSATGGAASSTSTASGLQLDPARVASLQEESRQVSDLLATIFAEEEPKAPVSEPDVETEAVEPEPDFFGLSGSLAQMARVLATRLEWSRAELEDVASDLELLLDGALERINDAFFSRFDLPLIEGDDPLIVNAEAVEKLSI